MVTTVTLDWDPPQGSGPGTVVDNYTVSISPDPPYQPATNIVPSPPWNITLGHNVQYNINLTAINCAGSTEPVELSGIEFSKLIFS